MTSKHIGSDFDDFLREEGILDDAEAVVRIRRISDFGDEDFRLFGVEFIDSDLVFRDWINGLLSARRPDEHGLGWDRAD